ncbi:MAG: ABC transporter permease [Gemmatimonadales bacterium]
MDLLSGFLAASVRIATPLLWAATGELVAERAGVINLSIEGAMLAGCLGAALGAAYGGPWVGVAAGAAAGLLVAIGFAAVAVIGRSDQIIAGTALTLASIGVTGVIYRQAFGSAGAGLDLPTLGAVEVPGLHRVPILGPALFAQPALTYLGLAAVPMIWWLLFRTRFGLRLRATGEGAAAAHATGVRVIRTQVIAVLLSGLFAGVAGATLVLAQVGTFAERMTAGRGFIAIAIVVLGRWRPLGVLLGALLFGGTTALQFAFQAMGLAVPYQFFLMLPYLVALVALAGVVGRVRAPAGLARTIEVG